MATAAAERWPRTHTPAGSSVRKQWRRPLWNSSLKIRANICMKSSSPMHTHTHTRLQHWPHKQIHTCMQKHRKAQTPTQMPAQSAVDVLSHICTFWDLRLLQGKANTHRLRGRAVCVCVCEFSEILCDTDSLWLKEIFKTGEKGKVMDKKEQQRWWEFRKKIIFRFSPNERLVWLNIFNAVMSGRGKNHLNILEKVSNDHLIRKSLPRPVTALGGKGWENIYPDSNPGRGSLKVVVRELWSTKYRTPSAVYFISQPGGRGCSLIILQQGRGQWARSRLEGPRLGGWNWHTFPCQLVLKPESLRRCATVEFTSYEHGNGRFDYSGGFKPQERLEDTEAACLALRWKAVFFPWCFSRSI